MIRIATLFAASALVIAPVAATAQPAGNEPLTMQVRYDDINLSTTTGRSKLDARIASAARKVCGVSSGRTTLREKQAQHDCVSKTRGEALAAAKTVQTGALAAK